MGAFFLLERGYFRDGPILIWPSSDDMINDKIIELFNSYELIIDIRGIEIYTL